MNPHRSNRCRAQLSKIDPPLPEPYIVALHIYPNQTPKAILTGPPIISGLSRHAKKLISNPEAMGESLLHQHSRGFDTSPGIAQLTNSSVDGPLDIGTAQLVQVEPIPLTIEL